MHSRSASADGAIPCSNAMPTWCSLFPPDASTLPRRVMLADQLYARGVNAAILPPLCAAVDLASRSPRRSAAAADRRCFDELRLRTAPAAADVIEKPTTESRHCITSAHARTKASCWRCMEAHPAAATGALVRHRGRARRC